jgi:hypothetical protein
MRIVFSTRLSGSCKFLLDFDRYELSLRPLDSPPVRLIDFFLSR